MYSKGNYARAIGGNIRRLREEKKISMETLAFDVGIEYRQLGRIERGEINTTIYMIYRIACSLEVEPEELIRIDIEQ